jgi:hypothetical protein
MRDEVSAKGRCEARKGFSRMPLDLASVNAHDEHDGLAGIGGYATTQREPDQHLRRAAPCVRAMHEWRERREPVQGRSKRNQWRDAGH